MRVRAYAHVACGLYNGYMIMAGMLVTCCLVSLVQQINLSIFLELLFDLMFSVGTWRFKTSFKLSTLLVRLPSWWAGGSRQKTSLRQRPHHKEAPSM